MRSRDRVSRIALLVTLVLMAVLWSGTVVPALVAWRGRPCQLTVHNVNETSRQLAVAVTVGDRVLVKNVGVEVPAELLQEYRRRMERSRAEGRPLEIAGRYHEWTDLIVVEGQPVALTQALRRATMGSVALLVTAGLFVRHHRRRTGAAKAPYGDPVPAEALERVDPHDANRS